MNIGNAMAFAGIAAVKDRADLIAYLKSKSAAEWEGWFLKSFNKLFNTLIKL